MPDLDIRQWAALAGLTAFVAIGVAAFCSSSVLHPDDAGASSSFQVRAAKTEARHRSKIPALHLQYAGSDQPQPERYAPKGIVTWRTIFGVRYGTTSIRGPGGTDWSYGRALAIWLAFLAGEATLLAAAAYFAWTSP